MKKNKTPWPLRFVRWTFPKLEVVAPFLAHRYFIKIFFSPVRYPVPEKEKEIQKQSTRFTISVNNKKIECYCWGSGPLIYVVHGWAGRASQFIKIIQALVDEGYKVVGFDGPAHGNSEGKSTDIIEFESVLKILHDQVGAPEAIIAHSFGGGVVFYAAMNGLKVKCFINIASPSIGDRILEIYSRIIGGSAKTVAFFKNYIKQKTGKTFDEFTSGYFIKHIKQDFSLLLVYDEDDQEVDIENAYYLMKHYPSAVLYKTKGLGHVRILKDESVINRCVTFIRESRLNSRN
nr:alpha/beta hydrolase family protein [Chryseosolibacter indicus]